MCVAQFRDYCAASRIKYDDSGDHLDADLSNPDIIVNRWRRFDPCFSGNIRTAYFVTDLKALRRLAKQGNQYAINQLKQHQ